MPSRRVSPMPPGWAKTRLRILRRDNYTCYQPGCQAYATHVDHVVPASQGGGDDDSNLRAICAPHHATKTGREAHAASPNRSRRREPEAHPGLLPPPGPTRETPPF